MAGPTQHRSISELSQKKKPEPPRRKLTKKERHAKRREYLVTWVLAIVFAVTSVGFLISFRPSPTSPEANQEDIARQADLRIAELERKAKENPGDPHWHYELAQAWLEEKGDMVKGQAELKATLEVDPSHLPALRQLAGILLMQNKPADAEAILKKGIAAEQKDLDRQNKARKQGEPPIPPDARLRGMLFHAYWVMGPARREAARQVAREGLQTNPREFAGYIGDMAMQMTFTQKKDDAMSAMQSVMDEAKKLNDQETVIALTEMMRQIAAFQMKPPQPGRSTPTGSPAPAAATPSPSAAAPSPAAVQPSPAVPAPDPRGKK